MRTVLILGFLFATHVSAYVIETSASGRPINFREVMKRRGSIGWHISGPAPEMLRESILFATKAWTDASGGTLLFIEDNADYQIDVVWRDTQDAQIERFLALAIANTYENGDRYRAKIIVNAFNFTFHRDESFDGCREQTANLDSVMLHEWGHILGLAHADGDASAIVGEWSPTNLPTMWSVIYPGCSTLHEDDVAGIQALYNAPAEDPEPVKVEATGSGRNGELLPKRPVTFTTSEAGLKRLDFGDGVIAETEAASVVHKFPRAGTYTVSVQANGRSGAVTISVGKKRRLRAERHIEGLLPTPQ